MGREVANLSTFWNVLNGLLAITNSAELGMLDTCKV
jgi:hypothetical protein